MSETGENDDLREPVRRLSFLSETRAGAGAAPSVFWNVYAALPGSLGK